MFESLSTTAAVEVLVKVAYTVAPGHNWDSIVWDSLSCGARVGIPTHRGIMYVRREPDGLYRTWWE